jgi:hypothetical protein
MCKYINQRVYFGDCEKRNQHHFDRKLRMDWTANDAVPDDPCTLPKGRDGLCAEAEEAEEEDPLVSDVNEVGCPQCAIKKRGEGTEKRGEGSKIQGDGSG